jgi:hypothetical protein
MPRGDEDVDMQLESPKKLVYDPDQDPEEKRKVRREYRSLHRDTEGIVATSPLLGRD